MKTAEKPSSEVDSSPPPVADGICFIGDHVTLPAEPKMCRPARNFVGDYLRASGLAEVADDAALAVSEAFANALRHPMKDATGKHIIIVRVLRVGGVVRIEVYDGNPNPPPTTPLEVGWNAEKGRGLHVIDHLAMRGWFPVPGGKAVFFNLADQ